MSVALDMKSHNTSSRTSRFTALACLGLLGTVLAACYGCFSGETSATVSGTNQQASNEGPAAGEAAPGVAETSGQAPAEEAARLDAVAGGSRSLVDFYTVDHYDKARNPAHDLAMTVKRAKSEKKHILVQVGGDWCGWCHLMSGFMEQNERVREKIGRHYLVMKVTYDGEQKNEAFLSRYPPIAGYPHLFVLDSEGNLLHSQDTADLEEGQGYNEKIYLAFLDKWKPA
jgi:hypothetical protein